MPTEQQGTRDGDTARVLSDMSNYETTRVLALDLGQKTGWAMDRAGKVTSGVMAFKPGRFEGGGMVWLRFDAWLQEIRKLVGCGDGGTEGGAMGDRTGDSGVAGGTRREGEGEGKEKRRSYGGDDGGAALKGGKPLGGRAVEGPLEVYFEEVRRHLGTTAAHVYGGFLAALTAWCERNGVPYRGVPVGTIKLFATGKGNAGKEAVMAAVRAWGYQPVDDNEADALALLRWALAERGKEIETDVLQRRAEREAREAAAAAEAALRAKKAKKRMYRGC